MKKRKKTGLIVTLIVSVSVVLLLVFILPPISMHLLSLKLQKGPSVEQETSEMIMDALDLKTDAIKPVRAYDAGSRVVVRSHLYTPAMGLIHFRNLRYDEVFLKKADGTEQRLIKMERGQLVLWCNEEYVLYLQADAQTVNTLRLSDRKIIESCALPQPGLPENDPLCVRAEGSELIFSLTPGKNGFFNYKLPTG